MRALTPETAIGPALADAYHHLANRLAAASRAAVEAPDILLTLAPEHTGADFAFACFPLAKAWRRSPAQIAGEIAEALHAETEQEDDPWLARAEAAGPYLNLYLRRDLTTNTVLKDVGRLRETYGHSKRQDGRRVMMEYVSPNTNKPLHLGHIRNAVLGRAVANLVASQGAEVFRTDIINDRGIHIAKSMVAYLRWGAESTPETSGTKGDHFVGEYYVRFDQALRDERESWLAQQDDPDPVDERVKKKQEERFLAESELMSAARDLLQRWEAEDEDVRALWRRMNRWVYDGFDTTYSRLGIEFDRHYYESDIYRGGKAVIRDAVARGLFETADNGAIVAPLSKHPELGKNLQDKVVQRADGTGLYITQDINLATIKFRDFDLDRSIYCIGSEQNYYMQQLVATLRLLGFEWADGVFHLSYGMVYLPEGKMKSREGTVVDADDLMAELADLAKAEILERSPEISPEDLANRAEAIGLAAIVFNFLLVGRETDIQFDPKASLAFEGKTGPYLQYTYARMSSLLRKAGDWRQPSETRLTEDAEWRVVGDLLVLPAVVADAADSHDPSRLAAHLHDAAQRFNVFWHELPVLHADEPHRSSRLALVQAARTALGNGMRLLALEPIEEM
ncbi:MAG: arginine--tRNA ligase [Thermoanaerobaculia bacterium]|nr:arginine--tRNA ligase [Thermoanaerobaculia bacterium]